MTTSARKRHGVVYTPPAVVELILDNVLPPDADELAAASICDPACGDGAFLTAAARRILSQLPKADALPALRRLVGYDIDHAAIAQCRAQLDAVLSERYPDVRVDWNLCERNAFDRASFNGDAGRFTHVVGNPPYVRVQHLERAGRQRIAGQWDVIRGATDLYLVFYELGLDLLRSGGTLGYITPSSWLRSNSGAALRRLLAQSHRVQRIIDFGQHQVFDDVTTYTAIAVIQKDGAPADIPVAKYDGAHFHDAGHITLDRDQPAQRWAAATAAERTRMQRLTERGPRLSEVADIHVGIQTLADGVFIRPIAETATPQLSSSPSTPSSSPLSSSSFPHSPPSFSHSPPSFPHSPSSFSHSPPSFPRKRESSRQCSDYLPCHTDGETVMLEHWIMRPIVKASVLKDSHDPVQRAVIFPYDDRGKLLPESYIADNAPAAYAWLLSHKDRLLNRDKGRFDPARWYAFGRHVSITSGFGPKILTSGMNRRPNFQLCPDPDATFYSGYCVKPKDDVDPEKLLDALNSDDMDFYICHTSRPYQGGWMSYAKSFIKDFPVPQSVIQ